MSSRRKRRKQTQPIVSDGDGLRFHPKAGPGQMFQRELIDMRSGHAKRFRNIASSPLMLAFMRGHLCKPVDSVSKVEADHRLYAGERFEKLWYAVHRSNGRDSTSVGIGGSDGLFWTEHRQEASQNLAEICVRMQRTNFEIVRRFCGEGWSMRDAVRGAGVDTANAALRVCEALDDLVYATARMRPQGSDADSATATTQNVIPLHPFHEIA